LQLVDRVVSLFKKKEINMASKEKQNVEVLLKQAADYVAVAQPIVDAHGRLKKEAATRAADSAEVLVDRGIISRSQVDSFIRKVAENPLSVFDVIDNIANNVTAEGLGKEAEERVLNESKLDAFERLVLEDELGSRATID
jgi:intergrase/recombinase